MAQVNYEFAIACLQVSGSRDDMCSTVRFMRDRNLLFSSDLETLQNYFASRARATKDQRPKTKVKQMGFIRTSNSFTLVSDELP